MSVAVLLFAFEPFGPWATNPTEAVTQQAAQRLQQRGIVTVQQTLPVSLATGPSLVRRRVAEVRPEVIVATGLAGRGARIDVELQAVNRADFRIPDNDGLLVTEHLLEEEGPERRLAAADVPALVQSLCDAGLPAAVSDSAGTYLCNAVYYAVLGAARPLSAAAVFLHLPPTPDMVASGPTNEGQVEEERLPLQSQVEAVVRCVQGLLPGSFELPSAPTA